MESAARRGQGRDSQDSSRRTSPNGHQFAQGRLQQSVRLLHRSDEQLSASRAERLPATADTGGSRTVCDSVAQGVRGASADSGRASRGQGAGAIRDAAVAGRKPGGSYTGRFTDRRRARCARVIGGSRGEGKLRASCAHGRFLTRDSSGKTSSGGKNDGAGEVHSQ